MKKFIYIVAFLVLSVCSYLQVYGLSYESRGIGGGGAMDSFSMSPYSNLWFVGTDMGTLFRSINNGASWDAISHSQTTFSYDLPNSATIGFSADGITVFHAYAGCFPQRSSDSGVTWEYIDSFWEQLSEGSSYYDCWQSSYNKRIRYWVGDSSNENIIYAGATTGLYRSSDKGLNWTKVFSSSEESVATVIDYSTVPNTIYHSTVKGIYRSEDNGLTFDLWHSDDLHAMSGGYDQQNGLTLGYIDNDSSACSVQGFSSPAENCGYVWVSRDSGPFEKKSQYGGDFIQMAENDSQTMYITGATAWGSGAGIGTSVWISHNAGESWTQTFQQYVDHGPWYSWDPSLFEMSAVAYDVGLHDDGYHSFSVNRRNSQIVGGTENYFLHISKDYGKHWSSPFTQYADSGEPGPNKRWKSNGLEVTSTHSLKFHPKNSEVVYAGYSDIGGLVSEDGGDTWRITRIMNTIYDHAFDPLDDKVVYAAASSYHDWPHGGYKNVAKNTPSSINYVGGIYYSSDRGYNWQRLTPDNYEWSMPFLSVAYDSKNNILYGGTHGRGIARSKDNGKTWEWFNSGLSDSDLIIGQIEIDPQNSDAYIMLSGDAPHYSNKERTGIYRLRAGENQWELLRGIIHNPLNKDISDWSGALWNYPVHFAIDWNDDLRQTMWLTDVRIPTKYLAEGVWKTEDGGQNWYQKYWMPDPARITIHPEDSNIVYVSGIVDGSKFNEDLQSGAIYTTDGGVTWHENFDVPTHHIISDTTIDPTDVNKIFYSTFGAGMFYGDNPVSIATNIDESSKGADKNLIKPYILHGTLYTTPEHPAVYLVFEGKRYVFPNDKVYFSWYKDFSQVSSISLEELVQYQLVGNVGFKPGSVVKIPTDPKVYVVSEYGILRWLKNPLVAQAVIGENWEDKMKDLWMSLFINYDVDQPIE